MRKRAVSEPKVKPKKEIPFAFVLEEIAELRPHTRSMFGAHAVYSGDFLLCITRLKEDAYASDNGIWIATSKEHHPSLLRELPSMRGIHIFSAKGPTDWRCLPVEDPRFEEDAFRLCALMRKRDPRIGRIPKRKKPRASKTVSTGKREVTHPRKTRNK